MRESPPFPEASARVSILLLAAGGATRMRGRDKLLEPVDGVPLLRRSAQAALNSRAGQVIVVLRPDDAARRAALRGLDVDIVENPAWTEGMASSIRAGISACIRACAQCDAVIVALADMPEIGTSQLDALIAAFDPAAPRILRACAPGGRPGNPVLFPRARLDALAALHGDRGARDLLSAARAQTGLVEIAGADIDLDTPEEWAAWRAGRTTRRDRPE